MVEVIGVEKTIPYKKRGYIMVDAIVDDSFAGGNGITMRSAYSYPNLHYIGESKNAYRLWKKFGITKFMPISGEEPIKNDSLTDRAKSSLIYGNEIVPHLKSEICSIGFSPSRNIWYGWSHRAVMGFTIGSEVKKGDIAFVPSTKEEDVENFLNFWDFDKDGNWTPYEGYEQDNVISKEMIKLETDVYDPRGDHSGLGIYLEYKTYVKDDRGFIISKHFSPYFDGIDKGMGEWKAETLEDAKRMAIDFANGVA